MRRLFFSILAAFVLNAIPQGKSKGLIELPFELVDNRNILFDVVVGKGEDTLTFYFDTGAGSAALDKNQAKRLGIESEIQTPITGAGGSEMYDVALNQRLKVGGQTLKGVNLVLLDMTELRETLGRPFYGILGYHILREFVTEVDFDRQVITLYSRGRQPNLRGYSTHSFKMSSSRIPIIPVTMQLENGRRYQGDVFFDSGAGLSLVVNSPFVELNDLREQFNTSFDYPTQNLGSQSSLTKVMLKKLEFAGYTLENVPIDLSWDTEGVSSYRGYLGILGAKVLNRFNFILDYKRMKVYLKPNSFFDKPFEYRVSGISLRKGEQGIYAYHVVEKSEAYRAGIREGDVLVSINGLVNQDIEVYRRLLRKEGTIVAMVFTNDSGTMEYRFTLKKLLD